MWYFAWLLGLPLAAAFGVLNAMWYELMDDAAVATAAKQKEASALPVQEAGREALRKRA